MYKVYNIYIYETSCLDTVHGQYISEKIDGFQGEVDCRSRKYNDRVHIYRSGVILYFPDPTLYTYTGYTVYRRRSDYRTKSFRFLSLSSDNVFNAERV